MYDVEGRARIGGLGEDCVFETWTLEETFRDETRFLCILGWIEFLKVNATQLSLNLIY